MPPATNTGTCAATSGSISCASTEVLTGPICPPASMPSITRASTPERISFLASVSAGAKQISLAPDPLILSIEPVGGSPPASTTWPTRWLAQTLISSKSIGCIVIRLTPNGRSVSIFVAPISASSNAGVIAPQAITPNPPALDIAETRLRSDTHDIAPAMIATRAPRKSAPRAIRRERRADPSMRAGAATSIMSMVWRIEESGAGPKRRGAPALSRQRSIRRAAPRRRRRVSGMPMDPRHMPRVDARYWAGITLASIFGTNLGDFYAHQSGLGIGPGLAILALLAAATFLVERRDAGERQLYYWLAIIIIRTGATNIADWLAYRVHVPGPALTIGLVVLLALFAWRAKGFGSARDYDPGDRLPATGPWYWAAMLTAGVLGTVAGDQAQFLVGDIAASIALSLVLTAILAVRGSGAGTTFGYWATLALARTAGTAIGDLLAERESLRIGLTLSTAITGTAFVALLLLWRSRSTPAGV